MLARDPTPQRPRQDAKAKRGLGTSASPSMPAAIDARL